MSDDVLVMGSCHNFAVALHRMTGWELAVVAGEMRGEEAVFHVVCLDRDGTAWDVRGRRTVEDLLDERIATDGAETWVVRPAGEPDVRALARAGKLHPIHDTHVLDALSRVDDLLDRDVVLVADGWRANDPEAVRRAREGVGPFRSSRATSRPNRGHPSP